MTFQNLLINLFLKKNCINNFIGANDYSDKQIGSNNDSTRFQNDSTRFQIDGQFEIGYLHLFSDGKNITRIDFTDEELKEQRSCDILEIAKKQLHGYFAKTRQTFDLPLLPLGTAFQQNIWNILLQIEFSETKSYEWVSIQHGNQKAIRAAAQAIGKNPIAIIIPCHRVIGKNGSLTGFAGGLERKELLLKLEGRISALHEGSMNEGAPHEGLRRKYD
jgi:methylated-DNA-[protein]-cysteine S-methyltransferase